MNRLEISLLSRARCIYILGLYLLILSLSACGGGSSDANTEIENTSTIAESIPEPAPEPSPVPGPIGNAIDNAFGTKPETARFLTQSTFGPSLDEINSLNGTSASQWFTTEITKPATYLLPTMNTYVVYEEENDFEFVAIESITYAFWKNAISADDQLRQRVAFALSELLVVSNFSDTALSDIPSSVGYFQDLLIRHAFGNYRDLLEDVTYSPAMGFYLTYLDSKKGDPVTGRMPDENYARELLQLFTIGVIELNLDGTPKLDFQGNPIETYNNADITGLAKVFTGLNLDDEDDEDAWARPMAIYDQHHSDLEKTFLDTTIAENTDAATSIDLALDEIFAHANVAPFVGQQLIQRLVTSNPTPAYVQRVATAFETGFFSLPDNQLVGNGQRGDMAATLAAILFDTEARSQSAVQSPTFGKVREPILRFTHWARAFDATEVRPEYVEDLYNTSEATALSQHPYRSPSVFNFFRPGYVAPGSESGSQGLKAPEMQLINATSTPGYINFIGYFVDDIQGELDIEEYTEFTDSVELDLDPNLGASSFRPDYSAELALATNASALVDQLDLILTAGAISDETKGLILEAVEMIPAGGGELSEERVKRAILMMMTSPDYLVQK